MELTGAQVLIECLKEEGVDTVFGYPGGAVLPIYDALYDSDIKHILVRHEQGAAHAADAYARATGKPGVCFATSGPGATNLVTGIANAYMDSVPLVAFTGQVVRSLLGRDSFQEADITGITLPITKNNYLVKDPADLPSIVKEAFYVATTGRPGPVLIDIPKDISDGKMEYQEPDLLNLPGYHPPTTAPEEQVNQAAAAIMACEKPVIYAGGGIISANADQELKTLAELMVAPVTTTLMGMGAFPGDHPLSLGMLGMHGTRYANYAMCECDLLLAVGVRFDDRVTGKIESFAPNAKIIHIDIDPAELNKNVAVNLPIVGNVKDVLQQLIQRLQVKLPGAWQEKIKQWKKEYPLDFVSDGQSIKPQEVIRAIDEVTAGQAYITTEVGQHQMWAAQFYTYTRPRSFISSCGLGTMGFGLPAAIGVQVGCPDDVVFDIAGDGSIQMNIQELGTAVQHQLPINVAIMNNGYLGMVRQWQEMFYNRRYSHTEMISPDYVKLAEAYGAEGYRIEKALDIKPVLEQAVASNKPVMMDFVVEKEENVVPMVPPGGALNNMLG